MKTESTGGFGRILKDSGFQAFLWTQFLGALNDNLYKTIVSLRAVDVAAKNGPDYLAIAGAVFVLPFLLFSGYSGHLSDRISKRTVMISVEEYHRLKRRDRQVLGLEDFTDADIAALEESRAPESAKVFDRELKP